MKSIVHLFNEIGMLARTPRSGFAFLGSGKQSVAEHSHRIACIGYALATLSKSPIDLSKLLLMCLLHDLPEARIGDLNYVNKRYVRADEEKVIQELASQSTIGKNIAAYLKEYNENLTMEARLAHDADQLELLLVLKELHDCGNPRAMDWFATVLNRVQTDVGLALADLISKTPSDEWWKIDK